MEGKNVIDRKNHGFGLKSVKGIVEKYGGLIESIEGVGYFETTAILYGIKDDKDIEE